MRSAFCCARSRRCNRCRGARARKASASGEMFVLWDGAGLVVKRVEYVNEPDGATALRLKSANPDYDDYTAPAQDVHIVGKVLWTVTRV